VKWNYSDSAWRIIPESLRSSLTDEQIILVESKESVLYTSRTDIGDQEVFKETPETVNIEVEDSTFRICIPANLAPDADVEFLSV